MLARTKGAPSFSSNGRVPGARRLRGRRRWTRRSSDAVLEQVKRELGASRIGSSTTRSGSCSGTFHGNRSGFSWSRIFEPNVMALLYLARKTAPAMIEAGRGAIVVNGQTPRRCGGKSNYAGFRANQGPRQRILAESIAPRPLAPKGVHVAPCAHRRGDRCRVGRGKVLPNAPDDFFFIQPDDHPPKKSGHVAQPTAPAPWSFNVESSALLARLGKQERKHDSARGSPA